MVLYSNYPIFSTGTFFVPKMNMEVIRYYFLFQMTNNEPCSVYFSYVGLYSNDWLMIFNTCRIKIAKLDTFCMLLHSK